MKVILSMLALCVFPLSSFADEDAMFKVAYWDSEAYATVSIFIAVEEFPKTVVIGDCTGSFAVIEGESFITVSLNFTAAECQDKSMDITMNHSVIQDFQNYEPASVTITSSRFSGPIEGWSSIVW